MAELTNYTRHHYVYDGSNNVTFKYSTDDTNNVAAGLCNVTEMTYTGTNLINSKTYRANVWELSWNI